MSDGSQGPGWWQASDGKWYPPEPPADPGSASVPAASNAVESPSDENPDKEEDSGKGKLVAIVLGVLLLIAAVIVAAIVIFGGDDDDDPGATSNTDSSSTSDATADIGDATGDLVDDGPILFDTDYDDALEGTRTEARYTIDAPDGAIMTLSVSNDNASERAVYAVFESGGQRFADFRTQPGATESEMVVLANGGGAPFDLVFTEGPAKYTFRIDLEIPNDAGQVGDAGSEFGTAFSIDAGQEIAGGLAGQDRTDHYTLELQSGTEFTFSAAVDRSSERAVLFTVELEGARIFNARVQPGADEEVALLLSDQDEGTLEVIVTEGPGDYVFSADFVEVEEGGESGDAPADLAEARSIDPDMKLQGQVGGRDQGDYYTFAAPSGSFTVSAEAEPTNERAFLITLEDESGSRLGSFRTQSGASEQEAFEVDPGSTVRLIVTEGPGTYSIDIR